MKSCVRRRPAPWATWARKLRDAVPLLKKLLEDPQEEVRRTAADALAKIQGLPSKAPAAPSKATPTKAR